VVKTLTEAEQVEIMLTENDENRTPLSPCEPVAGYLRLVSSAALCDVTLQKQPREVTAPFVALGTLLAAAAGGASIRWSAYP